MASTQPNPMRLLGELLQEAQEPFILRSYLLQRGYPISHPTKPPPFSSNFLKSLYNKLLLLNKSFRIKNCDDKDGVSVPGMTTNTKQQMGSQDPTCLPSEGYKRKDEAHIDTNPQRIHRKDYKKQRYANKDIEKSQEEIISIPTIFKSKKVIEDSKVSASILEVLVSSSTEKLVQQNKQLLFDCVREIIENNRGQLLTTEGIGKLICVKINEWGKQSGNGASINQLLNLDFQESILERNEYKKQKKEIGRTIGDDIMEELVMDMTDSLTSEMLRHL